MRTLFLFAFFLAAYAAVSQSQPKIALQTFATGFSVPVDVAHAGDKRLFVVEKAGRIWILDSVGNRLPAAFLNIVNRVNSGANERGLLGLAFHPQYAANGFFYVYYTRQTDGATRVSRFSRNADNPNLADADSELILLEFAQPFNNHNGGCIRFGPDGYLYIASGDGGSGGDPQNFGQRKNTFLGKILRIDVNAPAGQPYAVPADNPFVNDPDYFPEIWSLGWRNPWRFSFDHLTGDFWAGDVGQNAREEINFEPSGMGGRNYGWRCYEGNLPFNTAGCQPASAYTAPVFTYANPSLGCSVTGGTVYRGTQYPALYGRYIFADYCSGRFWMLESEPPFAATLLGQFSSNQYVSIVENVDGELYVVSIGQGRVSRLTDMCAGFSAASIVEADPCAGSGAAVALTISGGQTPYAVNWSDGAQGAIRSGLAPGAYSATVSDANGCQIVESFLFENTLQGPEIQFDSAHPAAICDSVGAVLILDSPPPAGAQIAWYLNGQPLPAGAGQGLLPVATPGYYQAAFSKGVCLSLSDSLFVPQYLAPQPSILDYSNGLVTFGLSGGPYASVQWYYYDYGAAEWVADSTGNTATWTTGREGAFFAIVSDEFGCTFQTQELFWIMPGTRSPADLIRFDLSPNPATEAVWARFELASSQPVALRLCDAQGRILEERRLAAEAELAARFEASRLAPGLYFVVLTTASGVATRSFAR